MTTFFTAGQRQHTFCSIEMELVRVNLGWSTLMNFRGSKLLVENLEIREVWETIGAPISRYWLPQNAITLDSFPLLRPIKKKAQNLAWWWTGKSSRPSIAVFICKAMIVLSKRTTYQQQRRGPRTMSSYKMAVAIPRRSSKNWFVIPS